MRRYAIICCLVPVLIGAAAILAHSGAEGRPNSRTGQEGDSQVSGGRFDGGFVDPDDREAMVRWARKACRGLDVDRVARQLGTKPTAAAVAAAIIQDTTEDRSILLAMQRACEAELQVGADSRD